MDIVVPPWFVEKMRLGKLLLATDNMAELNSGLITSFGGFNIYESNNVVTTGSEGSYNSQIMAMTSRAITYADQLVQTEALRLETAFADALRGLHVYGGKVVRPKELVRLNATQTAETNI